MNAKFLIALFCVSFTSLSAMQEQQLPKNPTIFDQMRAYDQDTTGLKGIIVEDKKIITVRNLDEIPKWKEFRALELTILKAEESQTNQCLFNFNSIENWGNKYFKPTRNQQIATHSAAAIGGIITYGVASYLWNKIRK